MIIRAKFTVQQITRYAYNTPYAEIVLEPQYDESIPEDRRFAEMTPNGRLEVAVTNPAAIAELALGRAFYLDFVPVDEKYSQIAQQFIDSLGED